MAKSQVGEKTICPGIRVREGVRGVSIRYECMANRRRFTAKCRLPVCLALDARGHATRALKSDYSHWCEECTREAGSAARGVLRSPTVEELIKAYEKIANERRVDPDFRKPSARSIVEAVRSYQRCVLESGLRKTDDVRKLMEMSTLEAIFEALKKTMNGVSAWSYLAGLQRVTARWALPKYRQMGFLVQAPTMPDVGKAKVPNDYKRLPQALKNKIEAWYRSLGELKDKDLYLAASMTYQLAVRPGDVGRLTAENFVKDPHDGLMHLAYKPNKTAESSNRRVDWPLQPELWEQIRAIAGERLDAGLPLVPKANRVYNKINTSMRLACDMSAKGKASYELRKLCIDTVYHTYGADYAVAISGDKRETIEKYYSDPYKINNITPIAIAPLATLGTQETQA